MIIVKLNDSNFEYDIHSLVKAFYPSENVSVCAEEKEPTEAVRAFLQMDTRFETEQAAAMRLAMWVFEPALEAVGYGQVVAATGQKEADATGEIHFSSRNRPEMKNELKRGLYGLLSKLTGQELPWGTLTGIRPTKIPMQLLQQQAGDEEITAYMKSTYLASDEKIALAIDIAKREHGLLSKLDYENGFSLYVGIPFCPSTCLYCSFTSYPLGIWRKRVDEYLDALEKELDYVREAFAGKKLNSIYIGGGTPTTLEPEQMDRLLSMIECRFDFSNLLEYTVEAGRPDSITREKLQTIYDHKISRISVNPQTMKQETLDVIGRHHTVEQTIESFQLAREIGFDNINMDLILGLPGESLSDVQSTMEEIQKLRPDNLTVHALALKRAARLNICRDQYKDYKIEITPETQACAAAAAKEMGMVPYYMYRQKNMAGNYENTGYGLPGKEGIYNILIMEEVQTIVACGAGTVTKRVYPNGRIERCDNVKDVGLYIEKIAEMIERKRRLFEEMVSHTI